MRYITKARKQFICFRAVLFYHVAVRSISFAPVNHALGRFAAAYALV